MLHRNPAKASTILASFIASLEQSSPRRAALVRQNQEVFLTVIREELRGDEWAPEIPKGLGQKAPMFAADDKTYQTALIAVFTRRDGTGPVLASNVPSGDPARPVGGSTPNYPTVFQARGLQAGAEQEKIAFIARKLDPVRLLACHSDPTLGPPVVWPLTNGRDWRYPVLAGNSRTVAILSAPEERYRAYEKAIRATSEGKGLKATPEGMRLILLRAVISVDGKGPLSENQAAQLAAVSQASTAGEESAIGRAISVMRSLGIRDVESLPPLSKPWGEAIHRDNVKEFTGQNSAFWIELLNRLGPIQRATYERDDGKAAEMLVNIFIGFLPREVAQAGFGDRKTEAALVAAMPALVSLHQEVVRGEVKPKWDLYARLPKIMNVYQILRRKRLSVDKAVTLVEEEALQVKLGGVQTALGEAIADPLSFVAAVMFYKLSQRLAPGETIKQWMTPYLESAVADSAKVGATGGGMFAAQGGYDTDPAQTLAKIISMRLPRIRPNPRKGKPMYSRPRSRSIPRRRNPDKAQSILDNFLVMLDQKMPRKAVLVRENKQVFLDIIREELAAAKPQPAPVKAPQTGSFKVGEALLLESPHDPGYPTEVVYRGKIGDNATVVYDGGRQMTIPIGWLSRPTLETTVQPAPVIFDASTLHAAALSRDQMPVDRNVVLWQKVSGYWVMERSLGSDHVKGDDSYWRDIEARAESTRPVAFFHEGIDPNSAREHPYTARDQRNRELRIRLHDALQIIAGTWNDNAKLQAIAKLDDGSYQDKDLEKLVVEAEADAAVFKEWDSKQDEIGMPKQDKRPPKPQPVTFSTKHLSTMTEAEAKAWLVQAAKYLTAMPSVNEEDNYVTDASGRKHGDQVGLSPQTDGPVRSFVDAYDDLGEELPSSYFLAAASYLRLHAGSEGEDGQLNNAEWSEAFDALKNVVSEDSEDTRLLLKADVIKVTEDGAETKEGYWRKWKSPRGNVLMRAKLAKRGGRRLTSAFLETAGLRPHIDFTWDKDTWEIIVQPDALPKFIVAITKRWPTVAATMRAFVPEGDAPKEEAPKEEAPKQINTLPFTLDTERFEVLLDLTPAGINALSFTRVLGDNLAFYHRLESGAHRARIPIDGVERVWEKIKNLKSPKWDIVRRTFATHADEWMLLLAGLKQSKDEGVAGGGRWYTKGGFIHVETYYLPQDTAKALVRGIRRAQFEGYTRGGDYPISFLLHPSAVISFSERLSDLFPRLAEALKRAFGGVGKIMKEDTARCAPLIDLSNKLEPQDVTNEVARRATREVIAAFDKRGPTNGFRPYGYQINGIAFAKLGGYRVVIGDAMGLGKTMQGLGAIIVDPDENLPCLVVAPASVLYAAWSREAKIWLDRILPARDVIVVDKPDKLPKPGFKGVCIVSWAFIGRSQRIAVEGQAKPMRKFINVPKLEALGFKLLIADEAHYAKTGTTARAKALIALAKSTPHVLLLTGTPIKNVVSDLWALLKAVQPDIWGIKKEFQRVYAELAEQGGHVREVGINMEMVEDLRQRLACSMIRRFKQDAMPDIPPMTRKIVDVGVSEEDRAELDYLEREFEAWLTNEIRQKTLVILEERGVDYDSLSPAQQHALSMGVRDQVLRSLRAETLVKLGKQRQKVGEIKAKTLGPLMARLKAAGEPTIFWAHHKAVVKILESTAKAEGLRVVRIDGSTPSKQRGKIVDLFQAGEIDAIIATMAAKEGLTLTAANRAYFVERYWTPADESQAEARIWRIGQTRPSTNYFLAVPDSIDQYMEQLVSSKRHLIDDVVGDETIEKEFHEGVEHAMADLVLAGVMRQS